MKTDYIKVQYGALPAFPTTTQHTACRMCRKPFTGRNRQRVCDACKATDEYKQAQKAQQARRWKEWSGKR